MSDDKVVPDWMLQEIGRMEVKGLPLDDNPVVLMLVNDIECSVKSECCGEPVTVKGIVWDRDFLNVGVVCALCGLESYHRRDKQ